MENSPDYEVIPIKILPCSVRYQVILKKVRKSACMQCMKYVGTKKFSITP